MDERLHVQQLQRQLTENSRRVRVLADEIMNLRRSDELKSAQIKSISQALETMTQALDGLTRQVLAPLVALVWALEERGIPKIDITKMIEEVSTAMHPNAGSIEGGYSVALIQLLQTPIPGFSFQRPQSKDEA